MAGDGRPFKTFSEAFRISHLFQFLPYGKKIKKEDDALRAQEEADAQEALAGPGGA